MPKGKPGVPATILGRVLKLKTKERLTLIAMLPAQGGLVAQILCSDIEQKTKITQGDIKRLNWRPNYGPGIEPIKNANGSWVAPKTEDGKPLPLIGWQWDDKADTPKPIHYSESEISFLKDLVDKIDADGKIERENLSLYKLIKYGQAEERKPEPEPEDGKGDDPEVV